MAPSILESSALDVLTLAPPQSAVSSLQSTADAIVTLGILQGDCSTFRWHIDQLISHRDALAQHDHADVPVGRMLTRDAVLAIMTQFVCDGIFADWDSFENREQPNFQPNQIAYLQSTIVSHE